MNLVISAVVFHHLVGMKNITPDLVAPSRFNTLPFQLGPLLFFLLAVKFQKTRIKNFQSSFLVLVLRPLTLASSYQSCRQVSYSDGAACLLHMLSAGTTGPESIYSQIFRVYLDIHRFFCFRQDFHKDKRCVAGMVSVKRGQPHQPVPPVFTFEIAIYIVSFNLDDSAFDTSLFSRGDIQDLSLIIMPLRPSQVHPEQHVCPILRLRPACTSMKSEHSISTIIIASKKLLALELFKPR